MPNIFRVAIPTQLRSYTSAAQVDVAIDRESPKLADVFAELERMYPGIRFRMIDEAGKVRPHIQVFVDMAVERNPQAPLREGAKIMIVGALSGG